MKNNSILAALICGAATSIAFASGPVVDITQVNTTILPAAGPIFLTLPSTARVTVTISHNDAGNSGLDSVSALDVKVNEFSLLGGAMSNGFTRNPSGCSAALVAKTVSCKVDATGTLATLVLPWQLAAPGVYALSATARHSGTGSDAESVTISAEVVAVEYPAPPAVANAYINSDLPRLKPQARGCIVSQIANNQAWSMKYGPRGGPYNVKLIQADVNLYRKSCEG